MNSLPSSVLYTQDTDFIQRVEGSLHSIAKVCCVDSIHQINVQFRQIGSAVLLVDLRGNHASHVIAHVRKTWPQTVIIAFGIPRSDPMLEAETMGIFATEDVQADQTHFRKLVIQGLNHLKLTIENQMLHEERANLAARYPTTPLQRPERGAPPLPLRHLYRAFRHFNNVEALLDSIVEGVAATMMLSRVGIVSWMRSSRTYQVRAGLRCLGDTKKIEFGETDPFIRWLELNAHLVSRTTLDHIKDPSERMLLKQTLEAFGAEAIIPLQSRVRLMGWIFLGQRSTGIPFDYYDLEDLMIVAEHISTNLENALLYEEMAVQKTVLETVLHSMPTGIVAVGFDGIVQWFNNAAQKLLSVSAEEIVHKSAGCLDSRLADILLRALKGEKPSPRGQWRDPLTKRTLSVQTLCLTDRDVGLGAIALIQDLTTEEMLHEKQAQLERSTFWTELATGVAHHVRNPLVVVQTFAQLLPERYDDSEFRDEFSKLVPKGIDRLNKIIDLIDDFAHPKKLILEPIDLKKTIEKVLESARSQILPENIKVETWVEGNLPPVKADQDAIAECLTHLLTNAIEATSDQKSPRIVLTAKSTSAITKNVTITVQDNGQGIPADIRNKVFSPFCTSKPAGLGLGLSIVQRTILDHNGQVFIDTSNKGTSVIITLPVSQPNESYESYSHR